MNKGHFKSGKEHHKWNNGEYRKVDGRKMIKMPEHPRAGKRGYVMEAVLIAEKSLGKYLPDNAVVHHIDNNPRNNNTDNLVICQNQSYHKLIHLRSRALNESGNPNKRRCKRCKQWAAINRKTITLFTSLSFILYPFVLDCHLPRHFRTASRSGPTKLSEP